MQSSLEPLPANVLSSATEMLGEAVTNVEKAEGGANNRVYRVRAGRRIYALKLYPATAGDSRDRLGTETAAISFMQKHGVRNRSSAGWHRRREGNWSLRVDRRGGRRYGD